MNNAAAKQIQTTPHEIVVNNFTLHANGINIKGEPTFDDWVGCMNYVKAAGKAVHFWLGDLLNYGEKRWGEKYREVAEVTGFDIGTLRNDKWVASRIPPERRHEELSFEHHKEVVNLDEEEQTELLETAIKEHLSRDQFRKLIAKQEVTSPGQKPQISRQRDELPEKSTFDISIEIGKAFCQSLKNLQSTELDYNQKEDLKEVMEDIATIANESLRLWDQ